MLIFPLESAVFKNVSTIMKIGDFYFPFEYCGSKQEFLACRETAWLGITLNVTPVYDVTGPDAVKLFNYLCVNKDFSLLTPGSSKHALICDEDGHLLADGVVMMQEEGVFRTYWLAPVLQYFLEKSGLDVKGEYNYDEYFFQIDGPKSLEILEKATGTDLHDIKFAKNKKVQICGTDMVVHRLGMSGCLAYEVHGAAKDAEIAYTRILEALEEFGGKQQGMKNYPVWNHTPAGYPNQNQHFVYAISKNPDLMEFVSHNISALPQICSGSASENVETCFVTPYDIGWGYLVNMNHDFIGKDALLKAKAERPRTVVTLEWNAQDVGEVYASQFMGTDVEPFDRIDIYTQPNNEVGEPFSIRCDYVISDGRPIGFAAGRTNAFYERRFISLAVIEKEYAEIGRELKILWGDLGHPQREIRATVAPFPYYNGKLRNETCDTDIIPRI